MGLNKKQKIWLGILFFFILVNIAIFLFFFLAKSDTGEVVDIKIGNRVIKAEVATSPWRQYLGLSNRSSLCANCGMLFIFSDKQEREFVMRNMKFPLDIIFIADGRIINISEKLTPEGSNPINIYRSSAPANQVLEINGGDTEKYGIKVGDELIYNN